MTCPMCGSAELRWAAEWSRNRMTGECRDCGTVYNAPRYGELGEEVTDDGDLQ